MADEPGFLLPKPPSPAELKAQLVDLTDGIDLVKPTGDAPFVGGFFADEAHFTAAVKAVRAAGHTNLQAWTPYPVHGLEDAIGLKRSLIGRPVFTVALLGFAACFFMQYHLMVTDWPTIYGGKPYYTWMLWVVPVLETGLLFGAIVNLLLAFKTCQLLPDLGTKLPDPRLTDDRFCLAVAPSAHGDAAAIEALLRSNGADELRTLTATEAKADPVFVPWSEPEPALKTMHREVGGGHHG